MTRRHFLEVILAAGGSIGSGIALSGCDTPLEILSPPSIPIETEDDIPALIIGSGFGGAVTALRLGEAGIRTMVLEQGRRWDSASAPFSRTLPPDGRSTWLRRKTVLPFGPSLPIRKYTGVLDRVDYANGRSIEAQLSVADPLYTVASPPNRLKLFYQIFPRGGLLSGTATLL